MTFLLRLFTGLKGWSVAIGAAIASALTFIVYLAGRKSGGDAVRTKQARKSLKAARKANEIREDVRGASDDSLNKRLGKYRRGK